MLNYYYSSDGRLLEIGYTKDSSRPDALENHYTILRNAMGDVAGLLTPDGTLVGTYEYDPYGRLISITYNNSYTDTDGILETNPFRYRGYYYDNETGWYYLQSRYYDPEVKRFINADTPDLLTNECANLMQYNLFMYCNGDPVNYSDSSGHDVDPELFWHNFALYATIIGLALVVVGTGGMAGIPICVGALGVLEVTAGMAIAAGAVVTVTGIASEIAVELNYIMSKPSTAGQMDNQIGRGQAPRGVRHVHGGSERTGEKPHIHFGENEAVLNQDGTWGETGKPLPKLTKSIIKWIKYNGWNLPQGF